MYNYSFYYGSALVRIIQDYKTVSIKLYSGNNCYLVNNKSCIYFKHSTKRITPWSFTFTPKNIKEIVGVWKSVPNTYIVLICSDNGICCLKFDELSKIIRIGDFENSKCVRISRFPREKYSVSGSDGELRYKIGDSDFPKIIFDEP